MNLYEKKKNKLFEIKLKLKKKIKILELFFFQKFNFIKFIISKNL
jgi:hypothetical protein